MSRPAGISSNQVRGALRMLRAVVSRAVVFAFLYAFVGAHAFNIGNDLAGWVCVGTLLPLVVIAYLSGRAIDYLEGWKL